MAVIKLRQNAIKSLRYVGTDNAQCIYWDKVLAAFGLRVFPNGRSSYVCTYRLKGRRRLATLGRSDVLTLEHARKKARVYLGKVCEGEDPQDTKMEDRAACTVKVLAQTYIDRHAKPKKSSWRKDASQLRRYLIPKLGTRLAYAVTSADIAKLHSEIGSKAPYVANHFVAVIKKMYNVGKIWGLITPEMLNPAAGIDLFPVHKRRRYVMPAEMPALAAALDADMNDYASHALWLLLLTGLRRSEVLGAKWSDVDWDRRTLHIGKTKNGEPLLATLSTQAIARLDRIPRQEGNEYIICGKLPGQPLMYIDSAWRRMLKGANLKNLRIHDLRRTVGSWLVQDGASLHLVGDVLNHRDYKTTTGYAYFQTQQRERALEQHGANVLAAAAATPSDTVRSQSAADQHPPEGCGLPTVMKVQRITRDALYVRVWSEPITRIASKLGISDVGLAKACRRANIPVPERGYWARVAAGQNVHWTPLPNQTHDAPNVVKFKSQPPTVGKTA
jgi:integrase